jgi:hypothetical protein
MRLGYIVLLTWHWLREREREREREKREREGGRERGERDGHERELAPHESITEGSLIPLPVIVDSILLCGHTLLIWPSMKRRGTVRRVNWTYRARS